jgi:hypothetical protein
MHIAGDVKKPIGVFCFPFQVDQVEKNIENPPAGEWEEDLVDVNVVAGL